jgi:type II secretory pathway pseudopilin PulG
MTLSRKLAYTLMEILVTISIIGALSAGGYVVMKNVSASGTELKLEQDVRTVNNAIRVYLANGGKLPDSTTADEVLVKIRRQSMDLRKNAGLKGSTIDPRLNLRYQSAAESSIASTRAYWNDVTQQFYLAAEGRQPGVKEFYLGDLPAPLPITVDANGKLVNPNLDDRQTYGSFAVADSWVWDYGSSGAMLRKTPTTTNTGTSAPAEDISTIDADLIILQAPTFSMPGGQYDLTWFPRSLTITQSINNPAGVSEIYYIVTGGAWQKYTGPVEINEPGITVTAKSVSLDLDRYADSPEQPATYTANQVILDPSHTLAATYRYAELGGPLAPGSTAPTLATVPRIYLANGNDIPDIFERDTVMQTFWSWDGSDPSVSSVGRYNGIGSFSNGYPGDPLSLDIASFASNNTLTLKYVTLSKNTNMVVSSAVETATTTIATTPLLAPVVTPGDGSLSGGEKIVMALNTDGAQTPANVRIYYRIDGTDPGDVSGEPAPGAILYTVPFNLDATNSPTVRVIARAYPPTAYKKWFTSSPPATLNYYLPYAEANVYGVLGGNREIYNINPSTGANQVFNNTAAYNLRALSLDSAKARIYYVEDNAVPASGWRLGYYDFITSAHVTLGNLRSTWAYNATAQPENLAFFNNGIYYIHAASDDLVRISLNADASGISAVTKIADLRGNSNWVNVGDMTVDETGLMFFVDSTKGYHRYDLLSMSGYLGLSTVAQYYQGLAFYQSRLFATRSGSTSISRLAPNTGVALSSVGAANSKQFIDLASPSSASPISITKSMWGIDDQSDGPHLIEFRNNYRSPLMSSAIDYGPILNNGASLATDTRYGIRGLAISNDGMAYFVNNTKLKFSGSTTERKRPLLKLNLGTLRLGDILNVTFVGDLEPGLKAIAGNIDPDDVVTGLALAPTGELFGILREGDNSGSNSADYLFKCTQAAPSMTGPSIGVTSVGRTTSAAGTSGSTEDLVFSRDGRLFCIDAWTNNIWELSPATGSVLSLMSFNTGCYHGLAIDTNDYRMIASDIGGNGPPDVFLQVNGGPNNDEIFLNYRERWGYATIEAISFFQAPFLLLSNQVDLFAVDGTKTIHGIDFATGQTVPVTDAPWPVRALAYDLLKREVFYLRSGSPSFTLGSFNRDTFEHKDYGDLKGSGLEYIPSELPDNLMYFGGYLWYVEPKTDNLIRLDAGSGSIVTPSAVSSSLFTTQVPASTYTDGDYELGMKFQSTVNGTITHIRYYRAAQETGSHTGRLWTTGGSQLASVTFTGETSSGWQSAALATPIAVTADTTYIVSVNNNTAYSATNTPGNYNFANGQLRSVQNAPIGVYHNTRGSFPDSIYQNEHYFLDVIFVGGSSSSSSSSSSTIVAQKKVANLNSNDMRFDLIGDLAMTPDGWVYFSAIRSDGQRFCRYQINALSQFEVLSGPIPSPVLLPDGESYRENWFDALAFAPPDAQGNRTLYSTYSAAPSPLHTVDPATGVSTFAKNILPSLSLIDFSDQHPGELANPSAITLRPLLKINDLQESYTYADVGGPFLSGTAPPPSAVINPTVILNNPAELLVSQQNSSHFQVRWSTDGVDPRTSSNASVTGTFTNGFPGQQLSVAYSLWGNRSSLPLKVVAKSLKTNVMDDSPLLAPSVPAERMELDIPLISEVAPVNGVRQVEIKPNIANGMIPAGTRIYYTIDGTTPGVTRDANGLDNPSSGQLYTGPFGVPTNLPSSQTEFNVTARLYPPTGLPQWFSASDPNYLSMPIGLEGGHMDVDTASAIYPYRRGKTDGHVHAYDKRYNVVGASFFSFADSKLRNIQQNVPAGTRFKIIVANADISPGGRLVINKTYNPSDPATWIAVNTYDNTLPSALPVYSLEGLPGTTRLTNFGLYFELNTIALGGLLETVTGHVKSNNPGLYGEWRNGALTIQAVKVNPDGSDAFTVNTAFSNGGVQGVATTGLLWETTFFYHGNSGPYGN